MTAKKALEELRTLIEERKARAWREIEEFSKYWRFRYSDEWRTWYSALNEALCCVVEVEKKIH